VSPLTIRKKIIYDVGVNLGRVGVWVGGYGPTASADRELASEIESLGYSAFWFGEALGGKEAFTRATMLLAATSKLVIGTGIASLWGRDPINTASAIRTIGEAFPGRFIAGLGVSHPPLVQARGEIYAKPLEMMQNYLVAMEQTTHQSPEPDEPVPVILAALRPKMLKLSSTQADGAHPYFVPVEHTLRAREILGAGKLLAPELAVVLERDPVRAREIARTHTGSFYLQAPNYVENLKWLGWKDSDFSGSGSDELIDAVVAWGDEDAIAGRIKQHLDAGADHVCIQPIIATPDSSHGSNRSIIEVLRSLSNVVRDL